MGSSPEVWPVACITGHRRLPRATDTVWLEAELERIAAKLHDEHQTRAAYSGMALGVDQLWADIVLASNMALWAAVPYPGQARDPVAPKRQQWTEEQVANWERLIELADDKHNVHEKDPTTTQQRVDMLHARNAFMVQNSAVVVAVWIPGARRTGTANALRAAASAGRPIIHVDPERKRTARPHMSYWARTLGVPVDLVTKKASAHE